MNLRKLHIQPRFLPILAIALLFLTQGGCKSRPTASKPTATPEDRKLLGAATPLLPQPPIKEDMTPAERRDWAWKLVQRVISPIRIGGRPGTESFQPTGDGTVPLWQTFYDSGEFVEMFDRMYGQLGVTGRRNKQGFCPQDLKSVFTNHADKSLRGWTKKMLEQRLGQLKNVQDVQGVSGKGVTLFSPAVYFHLLHSYRELLNCRRSPPDIVRDKAPANPKDFSLCMRSEFPDGKGFDSAIWDGVFDSDCDQKSGYEAAALWDGKSLGTSVAIKATWALVDEAKVASFDTSAEGIKRHLKNGQWISDALLPSDSLTPQNVYTITLQPSGRTYRLMGLHIATKELRHWSWVTLWWSDHPTTDFGEDRPASVLGPWANYKMCVVTDYNETSVNPSAEFLSRGQSSLAKALDAAHGSAAPFTWCSNPYIEQGKGNSRGNCIGCHQHAGANENPDLIFLDDPTDPNNVKRRELFPESARKRVRDIFPSDYLWSVSYTPDFFQNQIVSKVYEADQADTISSGQ